jgi:hypothetical protein
MRVASLRPSVIVSSTRPQTKLKTAIGVIPVGNTTVRNCGTKLVSEQVPKIGTLIAIENNKSEKSSSKELKRPPLFYETQDSPADTQTVAVGA